MDYQKSINTALEILHKDLAEFNGKFKPANSANNYYAPGENVDWTTGFHTGQYWLAYELTGDEKFKEAALKHVDSFLHRIENRIDVDNHDMGFLYTLSCVAAWRLVGSETGRKAAIMAADNLITRYHEKGEFVQAWGELGSPYDYRMIIDCMMNMPLLYWASVETGDQKYANIANKHMATSVKNLVREDYSTFHTFFFDMETGAPLKGVTAQGYKDSSPWARGQAWGVYGLALNYKYTQNPECIELFYPVTDFFLSRLPQDLVCYWDLDFTDGDGEEKDASAAAIAACGMLEMAKYLPAEKAAYYTGWAKKITEALAKGYAAKPEESNGLLLQGVYCKKSPYNTVPNKGVNECNIWGDYYWLELLTRLTTDWEIYW